MSSLTAASLDTKEYTLVKQVDTQGSETKQPAMFTL